MEKNLLKLMEVWSGFGDWIKNHVLYSVFMFSALVLVYYQFVTSGYFYIDSEIIINTPRGEYNWVETGRFGLPILKKIVGTIWYNPFLEAILLIVTLYLCSLVFVHLCNRIVGRISSAQAIIFSLLLFVYPIYADLFYFLFFSFEAIVAYTFLAIAGCYFYHYLENKYFLSAIVSLFFLIWSFSIYQNMVNLAICIYMAIYLLMIFCHEKGSIFASILHFFSALVVYEGISRLFPHSSYLSGQIRWGVDSNWMVIRSLLSYMKQVLLGLGIFYTYTYLAVVIAALIYLFIKIKNKDKMFWSLLIGIVGILSSPFYLAIVMGGPSTTRAQLMVPFVGAFLWLYFSMSLEAGAGFRKKCLSSVWLFVGIICIAGQLAPLMRLMYTQSVVARDDDANARALILEIDKLQVGDHLPVVFLGERKAVSNGSTYTWDDAYTYLAYSAFASGRMHGFLETLGYQYEIGNDDIKSRAAAKGVSLPNWPADGAVERVDDEYIVVKLSDALTVE